MGFVILLLYKALKPTQAPRREEILKRHFGTGRTSRGMLMACTRRLLRLKQHHRAQRHARQSHNTIQSVHVTRCGREKKAKMMKSIEEIKENDSLMVRHTKYRTDFMWRHGQPIHMLSPPTFLRVAHALLQVSRPARPSRGSCWSTDALLQVSGPAARKNPRKTGQIDPE